MTRTTIAAVMLVAAGAPALADEVGRNEYMAACAGCHGADATGNGPAAEVISIETPDLTGITARNGGEFPFGEMVAVIDGRTDVRAHGSAMPVWGDRFGALARTAGYPVDAETEAQGRILSLVFYLRSIQK